MIVTVQELPSQYLNLIKTEGEFYHEPVYLLYESDKPTESAVYYISSQNDTLFLIPLIERLINDKGLKDVSSPYGYSGYLTDLKDSVLIQEQINHFELYMNNAGYVSTFLRLNPYGNNILLDQTSTKTHLIQSKVVSIALNRSYEFAVSNYTSNRKREIESLKNSGYKVEFVGNQGISDFKKVYDETMKRVNAKSYYFFDEAYYNMLASMDERMEIGICKKDDVITCAALFMRSRNIVQYHLGGTVLEFMKDAPIKLVIDKAIERYSGKYDNLNLGGGVGSQEDSLFKFKLGFSSTTKRFSSLRIINDLKKYNNLCQNYSKSEKKDLTQFFPLYRSN